MRHATLCKSIYCVLSSLCVCSGGGKILLFEGGMISGHYQVFPNCSTVIVKSYPLGLPNVTESYVLKYETTILVDGINSALQPSGIFLVLLEEKRPKYYLNALL
jgi:hypothetical protein